MDIVSLPKLFVCWIVISVYFCLEHMDRPHNLRCTYDDLDHICTVWYLVVNYAQLLVIHSSNQKCL